MRAIISENLISTFAIIISIFLIFLIAHSLFSSQTGRASEVAYSNIAKGLADLIDRVAAEAGSAYIEYNLPKGLEFDVNITYRNVVIRPKDMEPLTSSFSSLTHTGDYGLVNPKKMCIIKNRYDRRIIVKNGPCECNIKDNKCDPECIVEGICDERCISALPDYVCIPFCTVNGDGICDPDCYTNELDGVWDSDCVSVNSQPDNICDPDSNGIKDNFCDLDCFYTYNFTTGVCDPDCKPKDLDGDGVEDRSDGICYAGCFEKRGFIYERIKTQIPDDAFCNPNDPNYLQCLGNDLYNCGTFVGTCRGGCQQPTINHTSPSHCHPRGGQDFSNMRGLSCCCINGDCYIRDREECILSGGYAYSNESSYCIATKKTETLGTIFLKSDGVCDLDCAKSKNVCDPDCPDDLENCVICTPENESYLITGKPCCSDLIPCPGTGNCSKNCCGDGFCDRRELWKESDNPKYWENPYTCPEDCEGETVNRIEDCNSGPFTSAPCNNNNTMKWYEGKIEICSEVVEKFLDRREWDINQIADDLLRGRGPPRGFAWDQSRYNDACLRIQNASITIEANENYNLSEPVCCCVVNGDISLCDSGAYPTEQCCGVGFCIDDATALLSILRRLGIPPKDVYMTFQFAGYICQPHAFVVYRCDEDLPDNMKLKECDGHWGEWLRLDATGHFIQPLSQSNCRTMCSWYNDQGLYATSEEGRIDSNTGWAYPPNVSCSPSTWEGKEICSSPGIPDISCNFNGPDGICTQFGIECKWGEHARTG